MPYHGQHLCGTSPKKSCSDMRRGFQRIALRPGEATRARFALRGADFGEVVHPTGVAAAAAAEWAVEVGPLDRALVARVAAPWADSQWTPHAERAL